MVKTNAMRLLDAEKIKYRSETYEYDENDLSGVTVAAKLSMPPEQLLKHLLQKATKRGIWFSAYRLPKNLT